MCFLCHSEDCACPTWPIRGARWQGLRGKPEGRRAYRTRRDWVGVRGCCWRWRCARRRGRAREAEGGWAGAAGERMSVGRFPSRREERPGGPKHAEGKRTCSEDPSEPNQR